MKEKKKGKTQPIIGSLAEKPLSVSLARREKR